MKLKKQFLMLAFAMVSVIALLYGISPVWFAHTFLGINDLSVDLAHILRAMMCLYIGLGIFWLYSAFNDKHRNTAILTTIVFAGGLVAGRVISLVFDGPPSALLIFYGMLEITLVPIACWIFMRSE